MKVDPCERVDGAHTSVENSAPVFFRFDPMEKLMASRTFAALALTTLLAACGKSPEPQPTQPADPAPTVASAVSSNVHEFKIGELTAFALKDGSFVFPNDAKTIGVGRTPEEIAA